MDVLRPEDKMVEHNIKGYFERQLLQTAKKIDPNSLATVIDFINNLKQGHNYVGKKQLKQLQKTLNDLKLLFKTILQYHSIGGRLYEM
ncbi:hypothetical protein DRO69_00505 [Candidatus Bathyarchaeota archaeon]|nr:MAG: hypothetical protein DRO69_00505 [Candidatus Bathyarchaeota archaeon]